MDDTTLSKAANIAAKQGLLLSSNQSAAWKVPRAKLKSQLLRYWTVKARSMTPAGVAMGGAPADVDETPMKKMVDRIIKHTTPATRQGAPVRATLPVKRKLKMPPPTPLKPPPFLPPPKEKKSLPKASPVVMRSKSKKQKKLGHSFKTSAKEGAKQGLKKGVEKALKVAIRACVVVEEGYRLYPPSLQNDANGPGTIGGGRYGPNRHGRPRPNLTRSALASHDDKKGENLTSRNGLAKRGSSSIGLGTTTSDPVLFQGVVLPSRLCLPSQDN